MKRTERRLRRHLGQVYTGIVGQHVLPALQTARRSLDIVSPYLSPEYAELLLSKARIGVRVRVITSNASYSRHQHALRILNRHPYLYVLDRRFWYYSLAAIAIGLTGLVLISSLALFASAVIVLILLGRFLRRREVAAYPLQVKVIPETQLVHVKLYVVDNESVFAGSANLTYSGMNRNIERMEVKTAPNEVTQEIEVFSHLWGPQPGPHLTPIRWKERPVFREVTSR